MVTLFSAARAAFCTSRGALAHLQTTPLCWRSRDIAVVMCRKECHQLLYIIYFVFETALLIVGITIKNVNLFIY